MLRLSSFSKCDSAEKVHVIMAIDELPVTAAQVVKESSKDKHLATVATPCHQCNMEGDHQKYQ